ncbi:MAG: glycosyltransferase [candidate division WOR-3 bacterium]
MIHPVRVCLATSSHPVTYSRFLHRQAASLARAGYDVTLVALDDGSKAFSDYGVRLIRIREGRLTSKLLVLQAIARAMTTVRPQVFECLDPWTFALGCSLRHSHNGLRLVYDSSEWFSHAFLERTDLPLLARAAGYVVIESIEYRASRQADVILDTNLTRARRFLRRGRAVTLIPNYPPLEFLPTPTQSREKEIIFTGLISRHRGFDRLLSAFNEIRGTIPDARLSVMGEFDPREDLETECRTFVHTHGLAEAVRFQGWQRYDHMLHQAGRGLLGVILLQPRRRNDYTGLPNKLFEFMGCGLAVVAADTPEMRRIVADVGCGWLVNPTSVEGVSRTLLEALSNPDECIRRGLAGRAAVLDRYNWASAEKQLLGCYRELLA